MTEEERAATCCQDRQCAKAHERENKEEEQRGNNDVERPTAVERAGIWTEPIAATRPKFSGVAETKRE